MDGHYVNNSRHLARKYARIGGQSLQEKENKRRKKNKKANENLKKKAHIGLFPQISVSVHAKAKMLQNAMLVERKTSMLICCKYVFDWIGANMSHYPD